MLHWAEIGLLNTKDSSFYEVNPLSMINMCPCIQRMHSFLIFAVCVCVCVRTVHPQPAKMVQ